MLKLHFASDGSLISRSGDGYAMQYSDGVYYVFAYVDGLVPSSAAATLVCTPNGATSSVTLLLSAATQTVNGSAVSGYGIYLPASVMQIAGPLSLNFYVTSSSQTVLVTYTTSVYVNAAGSATQWSEPITDAQWQEIVAYLISSNNYNIGEIASESALDAYKTEGLYYYILAGDPYTLQIYVDGSGSTNQMKTNRLTGATYNRAYSSSAWGAWALVANSSFTNYLPLSGGTLTGALGGTSASFSSISAPSASFGSYGSMDATAVSFAPSSTFSVNAPVIDVTAGGGLIDVTGNVDFEAGYTFTFNGSAQFAGAVSYGIRPSLNSSPATFQSTISADFLGYVTAANVVSVLGATPVGRATGDKNGNDITTTYLPLAGGTMTGAITLGSSGATITPSGVIVQIGNAQALKINFNDTLATYFSVNTSNSHISNGNTQNGPIFHYPLTIGGILADAKVALPLGGGRLALLSDFSLYSKLSKTSSDSVAISFPAGKVLDWSGAASSRPTAIRGSFVLTNSSGTATVSIMGLTAFTPTSGAMYRFTVLRLSGDFASNTVWSIVVESLAGNNVQVVSSGTATGVTVALLTLAGTSTTATLACDMALSFGL